jgi:hypothetical protein
MTAAPSGQAATDTVKISVRHLRKFLENPVHQGLLHHFGIYEEQGASDAALVEDEPFFSEFPTDYQLKIGALERWVEDRLGGDGHESEEDLFEGLYDHFSLKSKVPEGDFALPDKAVLNDAIREAMAALSPVIDQFNRAQERYRAVVMGESGLTPLSDGDGPGLMHIDAVTLDIETPGSGTVPVVFSGRLPWVWKDEAGQWNVLVLTGSGKTAKQRVKHAAIPLLFSMLCGIAPPCADGFAPSALTVHVLFGDSLEAWSYPLDPDASKRYLTELVGDYLGRPVPFWLPLEMVEKHLPKDAKKFGDPDLIRTFNLKCEGTWAETRDPLTILAGAVLPDAPFDLAERRLHPFFPAFGGIRAAMEDGTDTDTKGTTR